MRFDLSWLELAATLLAGGGLVAAITIGALLLVRQRGSRSANVAFGVLLLVASALVLYVLLIYVQPPGENLGIVFAPLPFTFALGPLLYAYVRTRLGQAWPGPVHWVLPVVQAVLVIGVSASPPDVQQAYMGRVFAPWWMMVQTALFVLGFGVYIALGWRALEAAASPYGWAHTRDRWLRRVLVGSGVALVGVVVFSLIGPLFPALPGQRFFGVRWVPFVETLLYSALLYATALGGWVQAEVRATPDTPERRIDLEADATAAHVAALECLVRDERPYLDPNLSLGSLADQVGITDKTLSAVFNGALKTTYTDYVNGLRVEDAKRRLADPERAHFTVLSLGLEAGFASKSTFNRVFKERTGQTPSAYRAGVAALVEA